MTDREKVIKGLEHCVEKLDTVVNKTHGFNCMTCPYFRKCDRSGYLIGLPVMRDALALLKAHETATVEPKRIDLADETKAWLDKMDAVDALGNIANICVDWDGYRTADGLGGLINEIWAYSRYCADRLLKAQEAVSVQKKQMEMVGLQTWDWACGNCGQTVLFSARFCPWCGRAVKWDG